MNNGPRNWMRLGVVASAISAYFASQASTWLAILTLCLMLVSLPGLVFTVPDTGDRTKDLATHFLGHWAGWLIDQDRAFQAWMEEQGNQLQSRLLARLAAQQVQARATDERLRAQLRNLGKP